MSCPLCNREVSVEGMCQRCHNRIHSQLDDLLEFWKLAHEELLPGKSGNGGRSSERTLGLNVAALSFIAGDDILGCLHEWEKIIRQDRNLTRPAFIKKADLVTELHNAVEFAQTHLQWSGTQEWIGDFRQELRELHSQGMAAARQFVQKTRKIACPAEIEEGGICGNLLAINSDDPLDIFHCRKCESEWTTLRLVAVAMSDPNRQVWLDAEAISKWMGITERHVHRIAKKNKVSKRGQLYDVSQLRSAVANA
jgi:hypothetical protein